MKNLNNNDHSSEIVETGSQVVRPDYTCNLLVSAIAHVSSDILSTNESQDDTNDETDPVQQVLDGAFSEFVHCDVIESFYDHGVRSLAANGWKPEKFENFNMVAEVWAKVQITIPFDPTRKLSLAQHRFIHRNVAELLSQVIDIEFEPVVSDVAVWLADDSGKPTVFLTGMFEVLEGRLTERKLKRETANAWAAIPSELLESDHAE